MLKYYYTMRQRTCENWGAWLARATVSGGNEAIFLLSARFFQNEELIDTIISTRLLAYVDTVRWVFDSYGA